MTAGVAHALDAYSSDEFVAAFTRTLKKLLDNPLLCVHREPKATLLGGQSGAGKTTLHKIIRKDLENDVIIINGDEYRKSHPHFDEIQSKYGKDAASHTSAWSGKMTETLVDKLSKLGYNLIVEGALRTAAVPMKTAELLRSRGYSVSLALMAVKPEISLLSCQLRYESMRLAGTTSRATDPKHHMKIVEEIVGNLEKLEQSGLFDDVFLYTRAEECLFPLEHEKRKASEVLHSVLFGPWTQAELQHKEDLEKKLAQLQQQS